MGLLPLLAASLAFAEPTGCPAFEIEQPRARTGAVVDASEFGFSETNDLNGAAIGRALAAARERNACGIRLAPGRYRCFDRTGIAVEGFEDFTFDGAGALLVFRRPPEADRDAASRPSSNFLIRNCRRMRFGNLAVDWDWDTDPLASFARLVDTHEDAADNESYADFEFVDYAQHPFHGRTVPVQTIMPMAESKDGFAADLGSCYFGQDEGHTGAKSLWLSPIRLRVWPAVRPDAADAVVKEHCLRHYKAKSNRYAVSAWSKAKGRLFRLAHRYYGKGAFVMDSCEHLTMRDIRIFSAFGMGFVTKGRQHHWQLVDCRIAPPDGVLRPITTTADANHVVNSLGWAKLIRFSVTMNQDDLSNFHDLVSAAKRVAPRTLAFTHARGNRYFRAAVGDRVELRQLNYEATGLHATIVEASEKKLVLDRDVPPAKHESYILFNEGYSTDHLVMRDCVFSNCTGRCCFMGNDITVENCVFRGALGLPLKFQAAFMLTEWAEGHGCTNVVVRGCTFEDCQRKLTPSYGKTVAETFVGRNLRVSYEAGGFDLPTAYGIVSGLLFEKNRWIAPRAPIAQVFCAENVCFRDNEVDLREPADGRFLPNRGEVVVERSRNVSVEPLRPIGADAGPFPPFGAVPEKERLPRGATLSVAKDGSFLVDGKPRYLTATLFYGGADECGIHTSGYPDGLKWLYEGIPGYEGLQRLGIDAVGFESGREWMREISPTAAAKWKMSGCLPATDYFAPAFAGQLPPYVDFTAAEWGHGGMLAKDNPQLPPEAWTVGRNHWVPYSVFHPQGRAIWLTMWRTMAERYSKLPTPPYCYELMNEPSVFDTGDCAKALFRASGRPDDKVEYLKFVEGTFASLVAEGVKTIHDVQPDAKVTLQPCGLRHVGVNVYDVCTKLDVVCSQTGGGMIPEAHMLRALADGKPIVDGETYIGSTRLSVRNALVRQFQRGFNASYTFKWSRRPRDWARGGDAEKEIPLAKRLSGYYYLNPYVVPADALVGFRMAKRDAMDVGEFFIPRDRGTPRRIAVLYSNPTERLALLYGHVCNQLFDKTVNELEYAHLNPDVIFEEQLREDPERLSRYRVLVAAGVEAVYPETPGRIRAWQASGGRLVQVGERMALDEKGKPNGETYPGATFVEADGVPAEALGRRLAELAASAGVLPTCETRGASKVEVTDAVRGGLFAWIVASQAVAPQKTLFRPARRGEMTITVRNEQDGDGRMVSRRREIVPDADGAFPLLLRPRECNLIVSGPRTEILRRYGEGDDVAWLEPLSAADAAAAADRSLEADRAAKMTKSGGYRVRANLTHQFDLRREANVRKLTDALWGLHEIEGVPFGFIRTDQNFFRDAVALEGEKKSVSLPLEGKVLHLYFAYAGDFTGTVGFADGTEVEFAAPKGVGERMRVWRWTSPRCDKDVRRVALRSDRAILYAVTAEQPAPKTAVIAPEMVKSVRSFSGKNLEPKYEHGVLSLLHGKTACSWTGANMKIAEPIALPSGCRKAWLAMEVNRLPNRFGAYVAALGLQINVALESPEGKVFARRYDTPKRDDLATDFFVTDDEPLTWETVFLELPAKPLAEGARIKEISFQYKNKSGETDPSPLALANLRVEGE